MCLKKNLILDKTSGTRGRNLRLILQYCKSDVYCV
ncbi:rCG48804 [Rattus norvegicus]|uniref:RCG48804 n=1 Tax=Rattus norvegicus TaxID=10116 RepID=A6IGJ8_RAT|nr:rCG48804 [Rattus norvegicus]